MTSFHQLIQTLKQFESKEWINQYFDLLKRILIELHIHNEDPRLALSNPKNKILPVNVGQRYILKPLPKENMRCIVPAAFEEQAVGGNIICWFSPKTTRDAKWIQVRWKTGAEFPEILYNACIEATEDILRKCNKTGYRRYHSELVYDFTMETVVRTEVLSELNKSEADLI